MTSSGRYELKYFLPHYAVDEMVDVIKAYVQPDAHARVTDDGVPRYTIRSVYLDNDALRFYHEKIDGMRDRKKLRVRAYSQPGGNDMVFLEIKHRDNTNVLKERTALPLRVADALLGRKVHAGELALAPGARRLAERFAHFCHFHDLRPVINVMYERTPFVGRADESVRLTIDVNLRAEDQRGANSLFEHRTAQPVPLPGTILELKFDRLMPEWMRRVVRHFDLRQESISKYCHSVDAVVLKHYEMP